MTEHKILINMNIAPERQSIQPNDKYVHRRKKRQAPSLQAPSLQAPNLRAPSLEFAVERSEVVHTSSQVAIGPNSAVSVGIILRSSVAATARGRHLEGARVILPVLDRFDVSAAATKAFIKVCLIIGRGKLKPTASGYTSSILG